MSLAAVASATNVNDVFDADELLHTHKLKPSDELTNAMEKVNRLDIQNKVLQENILYLMERLGISKITWILPITSDGSKLSGLSPEMAEVTKKITELTHKNIELSGINNKLTAQWQEAKPINNIPIRITITRDPSYEEYAGDYSRGKSSCASGSMN